jgi:2Fe-2S ferredoxin
MISLVFVRPDGVEQMVDADPGFSVMEAAVAAGVRGIVADCGGGMTCGTCHVYLSPETYAQLGPPGRMETELLEFAAAEVRLTSRLSCQVNCGRLDPQTRIAVPDKQ